MDGDMECLFFRYLVAKIFVFFELREMDMGLCPQNIERVGFTGKIFRNKELARELGRSCAVRLSRRYRTSYGSRRARFHCALSVCSGKVVRHRNKKYWAVQGCGKDEGRSESQNQEKGPD